MVVHQAKTNEDRMLISDKYHDLQAVLEKRKSCLETINAVTKMEDLFSNLSFDVDSTALRLAEKSQKNFQQRQDRTISSQEVAENCMKSLHDSWDYIQSLARCSQIHLQNAAAYHQFWHEVEESNEWLQYQLTRVPVLFNTKNLRQGSSVEIKQTMSTILDVLKDYLQWQTRFDILYERSKTIYPIHLRKQDLKRETTVQVLVDYSTKDYVLSAGDTVILLDNTDEKRWKIKIETDKSPIITTIPAILLVVPPTDPAALDAALRLRMQMLSIWTAASKILSQHVTKLLLLVFNDWNTQEREIYGGMSDLQRKNLLSTIKYMEQTLGFSLKGTTAYERLIEKCTDVASCKTENGENHKVTIIVQVTLLQKLLQRYWDFWTYYESYREVLETMRQPRNIFICNKNTQFKYMTAAHYVRYMDVDLEDQTSREQKVESEETIQFDSVDHLHSAATESASVEEEEEFYDSGAKEQMTNTEGVIEAEMEVETTFVITGVVQNPGQEPEEIISLQEAIERGIIDPANGLYRKRGFGTSIPIPQAMNEGLIKMGPKQETKKTEEKVKSQGIITVRTTRETRPYTVIQATSCLTGGMLDARQAYELGILDPERGTFKNNKTGNVMLIGDAVDAKLVEIKYEDTNTMVLEEVCKTYVVHAVVCQKTKSKLPFHEAVQKGIIDGDTGAYFNSATGENIFVVDAINKGYIKATESDKPPSLHIGELGNIAVNDKIDKIRKKILNPLRALQGMKKLNGHQ